MSAAETEPKMGAGASAVRIRLGLADDLSYVKAMLDSQRQTFGFLPRAAIEDAIAQSSLFIAESSCSPLGFARVRYRRDAVTIVYEIVVMTQLRRRGIGTALIDTVKTEAKRRGHEMLQLKCPAGLSANDFYARLGFELVGQEPGKGTALNVWGLRLTRTSSQA